MPSGSAALSQTRLLKKWHFTCQRGRKAILARAQGGFRHTQHLEQFLKTNKNNSNNKTCDCCGVPTYL